MPDPLRYERSSILSGAIATSEALSVPMRPSFPRLPMMQERLHLFSRLVRVSCRNRRVVCQNSRGLFQNVSSGGAGPLPRTRGLKDKRVGKFIPIRLAMGVHALAQTEHVFVNGCFGKDLGTPFMPCGVDLKPAIPTTLSNRTTPANRGRSVGSQNEPQGSFSDGPS